MDAHIQKKLETCKTLPTLPAVAGEIVRLCNRDDTDVTHLSAMIAKDPAIATKILSVANTIMFVGRAGKSSTVSQAVARLGKNSVMTLSLSFSLARLQPSRPDAFDYQRFWKRSLLSATTAGYLGELTKVSREEAFLGGMFQDIGMLALQEALGDDYGAAIKSAGRDHLRLERQEREAFGTDHRSVGAYLATSWRIPDYLVHTTRGSHNPLSHDVVRGVYEGLVKSVALSGYVADIWAGGEDRAASTRQAAECARLWLDMNGESFTRLLSQVARAVPELSRLFEISVDERALNSTLAQAKEALVKVSLKSAQDAQEAQSGLTQLAKQKEAAAQAASQRDALTGLADRAHFDAQLSAAYRSADEVKRPLSIIMCEIDELQAFIDKHGAKAGECAIQSVGKMLARCARQLDVPARYSNESFAIILPGTERENATLAAERLRKMLERLEIPVGGGRVLQITGSFGCATMDDKFRADSSATLVKEASACLFAAMREGRNRVVSGG